MLDPSTDLIEIEELKSNDEPNITQQSELNNLLSNWPQSLADSNDVYKKHGQEFYRRENLDAVEPSKCKDAQGNWTKWVFERMTQEQVELFTRMKEHLCNLGPPFSQLSDNHIMRYLQSLLWDFDQVLEYIQNGEKARQEFDCVVLREEEFVEELSWNAFVFNSCYDKVGRPIFWLRWGKWFP